MYQIANISTLNYYQVLDISYSATPQEIRKAYHKLVKIYHPDRHRGLPQLQEQGVNKLKHINKAYAVLSQPNLRRGYDISLNEKVVPWVKSQAKHPANPFFSELTESKSKGLPGRLWSSFYSFIRSSILSHC